MVAGYAIGGGHVLHVVCDLTIAADNARFGQTGPKVGSFDGGYGSGLLARQSAEEGARRSGSSAASTTRSRRSTWGLVNTVVPLERPRGGDRRSGAARCSRSRRSRCACSRRRFNAADDGLAGIQQLAGDATLLFYMSEEAQEGRDAYVEKRQPDFSKFPRRP